MKKILVSVLLVSILVISGCSKNSELSKESVKNDNSKKVETVVKKEESLKTVPFSFAKNYFVKNSASEESLKINKIESIDVFESIFGMATLMGDNGTPTVIDFKNQFLVSYIVPETDIKTEINVKNIIQNEKNELVVNLEIKEGEKQSFTSQPFILLIVDKKYNGDVVIKK
ncbi:hypothetical protein JXR93_05190 [bacterium]|nr:hypothetical protein [bacterium]